MLLQLDGITLSFLSAILFGASAVSARIALRGANMVVGAMLAVITGLPLLFVVAYVDGEFSSLGQLTWQIVLVLGLSGISNFLIGRLFTYRAIETIGANRSYALITTFPVYASILAVLFLGEPITTNSLLAIVLIVVGGVALSRSKVTDGSPHGLSSARFGAGVRYGILAGVFFGISNFLTRVGVRQTPFPVTGAAVSFIFALIGYVAILAPSGQSLAQTVGSLKGPRRAGWFVVDGFIRAGALICSYSALQSTSVVIVSPIVASQSLFAILLTYVAIRKIEAFAAWVLVGAVLILTGIVVLYLPTI